MSSHDFLHQDAATELREHYRIAGTVCRLATNSQQLLAAARESFLAIGVDRAADFSLRLWVDDAIPTQLPWPKPYVRGLDHLVFAGFDAHSSMLADLRARSVIGRFSTGMAADSFYWRTVIFPITLSILAGSIGLVELHAACVARDERGLLLIGPSCSGKSTLAMALTAAGFRFLSDDRTFCSNREEKLTAWGMPRPLKLRREAAAWFEELRGPEPVSAQDGERVLQCEPNQQFGRQGSAECEPRALVFLEREPGTGFSLTPMKSGEARLRIEQDLLAETPEVAEEQAKIIDQLLAGSCWRLRYGGRPQVIAGMLMRALDCIPSSRGERTW